MKATIKVPWAALAAVMATSQPATAQFQTGNDLFTKCRSEPGYAKGACIGYIMGANDEIAAMQFSKAVPAVVCVPATATVGQVTDVVIAYLNNNPS